MMMSLECAQIIGRRWFENNEEIDHQHLYETGEQAKDFTEVTTALKKPQATKCSDHRKSAFSHTQQRWYQRHLEGLKRKLRMYSEKINLDLEEEKELGMQLGC